MEKKEENHEDENHDDEKHGQVHIAQKYEKHDEIIVNSNKKNDIVDDNEIRLINTEINKSTTETGEFDFSDDLRKWSEMGRVHEVILRVRIISHVETDLIRIELNGAELAIEKARKINQLYTMEAPRYRVMGGYWYVFRLEEPQWPVKGNNEIEVVLLTRDADIEERHAILRDLELETKYLKGKNFHRSFSDPDLGAYDYRS